MLESVIVGVLSLAGTVIGSFSGMRLMSYRIEQLEKRWISITILRSVCQSWKKK